ncbi:efflux transporter periplasmic adaptor subunit [Shewanella colwelliana]|uniref:Efflux transporter periplasmic adaptor subunit n=1 Tax=Shewanella colwelliana TaxID=23 RepID=A0A1E5IYS1_SHECO|nr:efflux RND transporter periplasmic adaptor subunit [Shewanella colwelliana]OEG75288.1 efflux transporter periplasmic adaptor subunit [Shewanella colwelliana]
MNKQLLALAMLLTTLSTTAASADIETLSVDAQLRPQWVSLDAQLEAVKSATVSAQTSGRIIKVNYDVNDIVPQGAALLEITSKAQGAELAAAEAELARAQAQNEEAQKQRKRYEELFPQGAISQGDMDQAIANARTSSQAVSAAKARIIQANESLQYTIVSAPFSGIVTQRYVEEGETVAPGQPLLSGFSTDQLRAVTNVPFRYINALRSHPEVQIFLPNGDVMNANQLTIFSFADPSSHSYKTRINLPSNDAGLMPGMWLKVQFIAGQRSTMMIPQSAVLNQNELSAVYLIKQGEPVLNQVRLGAIREGYIEVLAGLSPGDNIAIDAYQVLLNLNK